MQALLGMGAMVIAAAIAGVVVTVGQHGADILATGAAILEIVGGK